MSIGWHGSFDRLLDLISKEELQFTHHGHLKSLGHDPTKFLTKRMISTTKYYVIDIYWAHKYIFANFVSEKVRTGFAYFKALFKQEFLKAFIQCSCACLSP